MKFSRSLFICIILFSAISIFAQSETEKGVELYRNGDFDSAITILQNAVKTDKKDRKAWTYLGASLLKKGKNKEATKAFRKANSISLTKLSVEEIKAFNDGLNITSKPRASYTDSARMNQIQGTVTLVVEFGGDGKLKSTFVIESLPFGLTENCLAVVQKITFEPAHQNGTPISVVAIIKYNFVLY